MRERPRKHVRLIELEAVDMETVAGEALPVRVLRVPLGGDKRAVVFTISKTARAARTAESFQQLAQVLGNLVHPHPATIVVLPDGEQLGAYEAIAD